MARRLAKVSEEEIATLENAGKRRKFLATRENAGKRRLIFQVKKAAKARRQAVKFLA